MRFRALAVDYDGTLATDGQVDAATLAALRRLRESGRRLVLVTGRIVDELLQVFPQIALCDLVVADNGAVLFDPASSERQYLAGAPSQDFIDELIRRRVPGVQRGDVVVATWQPYETTVLETIRDLGLELQIIFNKGAVMVLPTGTNKATGLQAALGSIQVPVDETVGIGDAENDESFLRICGFSAAVANALDVLKARVHYTTRGARGAGTIELINHLVSDDLESLLTEVAATKD